MGEVNPRPIRETGTLEEESVEETEGAAICWDVFLWEDVPKFALRIIIWNSGTSIVYED